MNVDLVYQFTSREEYWFKCHFHFGFFCVVSFVFFFVFVLCCCLNCRLLNSIDWENWILFIWFISIFSSWGFVVCFYLFHIFFCFVIPDLCLVYLAKATVLSLLDIWYILHFFFLSSIRLTNGVCFFFFDFYLFSILNRMYFFSVKH